MPPDVVRITKTVAVKVPYPQYIPVPHSIPYPYPVSVARPFPVEVPKLIPISDNGDLHTDHNLHHNDAQYATDQQISIDMHSANAQEINNLKNIWLKVNPPQTEHEHQ